MAPRPGKESEVSQRVPLRPGYVFVKKGDPYITRHCRQLTKETGNDVFAVVDDTTRRPLGLRVPARIHTEVLAAAATTHATRAAATAARDARTTAAARATLLRLFPATPPGSIDAIVAHAFRKGSGRVGRNGELSLEEKVTLGLRAHVRHVHTAYEGLMKEQRLSREEARARVVDVVDGVVGRWSGEPGEKVGAGVGGGRPRRRCSLVLRGKEGGGGGGGESGSDSGSEDEWTPEQPRGGRKSSTAGGKRKVEKKGGSVGRKRKGGVRKTQKRRVTAERTQVSKVVRKPMKRGARVHRNK